jgi:hypothetical protein
MLRTVSKSSNSKTGPIAVTYRSGQHSTYSTCQASCPLNPKPAESTAQVDKAYLLALSSAVPKDGQAWTYSHFHWSKLPAAKPGRTVINFSADSVQDAVAAVRAGRPAVLAAAPAETRDSWPMTHDGVRFVVCPEQLAPAGSDFSCSSCGNGRPLCARPITYNLCLAVIALRKKPHGSGYLRQGIPRKLSSRGAACAPLDA